MTLIISPNDGVSIVSYETWMAAIASSACIGFTSLVPWLFNLTFFEQDSKKSPSKGQDGNVRMKYLLSFAIGAILGDIFFHLIPESYESHLQELNDSHEVAHKKVGISIIAGIFMFIIVEMMLEKWSNCPDVEVRDLIDLGTSKDSLRCNSKRKMPDETIPIFESNKTREDLKKKSLPFNRNNKNTDQEVFKDIIDNNNSTDMLDLNQYAQIKRNIVAANNHISTNNANYQSSKIINGQLRLRKKESPDVITAAGGPHSLTSDSNKTLKHKVSGTNLITSPATAPTHVNSAGYLNLIANGFDNFTHGLAIGASFLIGSKVGLLTTFVIIIHEIPHEICDYAILVKSGFSRWEAVKAQSSVSLFGIIGTATALYVKSVETLHSKTIWILPFSAGGFLYIALVNLLPEILDRRTDLRSTLGQIICVILGVLFMAIVAIF